MLICFRCTQFVCVHGQCHSDSMFPCSYSIFLYSDDVTYVMLTDDRTESVGGLCVTRNRGRPGARVVEALNDPLLSKSFDGQTIRHNMRLTDSQSLLLALAWITDTEHRLLRMFPEVLFMDVTSQTNNEKRGLFLAAGKDSNAQAFTACRIFLPSEQRWVFQWIFSHALPFLFGPSVLRLNRLCLTDGDKNEYESLKDQFAAKTSWSQSTHALCEWHLLSSPWRKEVICRLGDCRTAKKHGVLSSVHNCSMLLTVNQSCSLCFSFFCSTANIAYRWIQTWFNYIETHEEFDVSYQGMSNWLSSESSGVSPTVAEVIRNFVIQTLLPKKVHWLRSYRLKVRGFDEKSNSLVEGQNSSMKHGSMPVRPNMSLKVAAKTMLDKTELLHSQRTVVQSKKTSKTSLWSNSNISGILTCYAEGLVTEQMERREQYHYIQGLYLFCLPSCSIFYLFWLY